jgi:hypothetical protein
MFRRPPLRTPHSINPKPKPKGTTMKPVIRRQSQLLFRKSYKPDRVIRIRPLVRVIRVFRPTRPGSSLKPA